MTDECIKKNISTHNRSSFSHTRNEIMLFVGNEWNWESVEQHKSISKGQILHVFTHMWNLDLK
jgi:hypothetical protein